LVSIVVTGSWVQDAPNVDNTGDCASEATAAMVARCMALELGEHRIRVNVVAIRPKTAIRFCRSVIFNLD
jgi:NAD(P)-dependent dehydrogenase (short-subunit alcohol dehydrogenase family)